MQHISRFDETREATPSPLIRYTSMMGHRFVVVAVFLFLVLFLFVDSVNFVNCVKLVLSGRKWHPQEKMNSLDILDSRIGVLLRSKAVGKGLIPSNLNSALSDDRLVS